MNISKAAQILGRRAKGKPKHFSTTDIKRLTLQLKRARKLRWKT